MAHILTCESGRVEDQETDSTYLVTVMKSRRLEWYARRREYIFIYNSTYTMQSFYKQLGGVGLAMALVSAPFAYASVDFDRGSSPITLAASQVGSDGSYTGTFHAQGTGTVLIDLEIRTLDGVRLKQSYFNNESFAINDSKTYAMSAPADLPPGTYRVDIGVFRPDWSELLLWNSNVAQIAIADNGTNGTGTTTADAGDITLMNSTVERDTITPSLTNMLTATFGNMGGNSAASVLDFELYDRANGHLVNQQTWDNVSLDAGSTTERIVSTPNLPNGDYSWNVGIFNAGWGKLLHWYDNVALFSVRSDTNASSTSASNSAATSTLATARGATRNGNIRISSLSTPSTTLAHGTPQTITIGLTSDGGENANNVTVHTVLYNADNNEESSHQIFAGKDILHEGETPVTLWMSSDIASGSYRVAVLVYNQDGTLNSSFENLDRITVR